MQWIEGSERTESAAGRRQFSAPTYRTEQRKARKFWRARDQGAPRNILSGMQFDPDKEDLTARPRCGMRKAIQIADETQARAGEAMLTTSSYHHWIGWQAPCSLIRATFLLLRRSVVIFFPANEHSPEISRGITSSSHRSVFLSQRSELTTVHRRFRFSRTTGRPFFPCSVSWIDPSQSSMLKPQERVRPTDALLKLQ